MLNLADEDNSDDITPESMNIMKGSARSPRRKLQHRHRKLHFDLRQSQSKMMAPVPPALKSKDLQFVIPTRPQTAAANQILAHSSERTKSGVMYSKRPSRRSKIYF